jgi:hypothetical protein
LARFGELEPFDFGRLPAADHAFGGLGDESDAHQTRQLLSREAVHKHDRFGAAFGTAAREQHDCAALMGLEDATAGRRHGGGRGVGANTVCSDYNHSKPGSTCTSGHHWDTYGIIS